MTEITPWKCSSYLDDFNFWSSDIISAPLIDCPCYAGGWTTECHYLRAIQFKSSVSFYTVMCIW